MKKRHLFTPLLLFITITLAWIGALAAPGNVNLPPAAATPGGTPEAPLEILDIEAAIQKAIAGHKNLSPAYFSGGVTIENTRVSADGQWAVSYLIPTNPITGEPVPTEPGLTIVRRDGRAWAVSLPTSDNWIEMVRQVPYDVLPFDQKVMWTAQYTKARAAAPQQTLRGYLLPWDAGITRYLSTSVCHDEYIPSGNAHYAFDFYTSRTMWDILAIRGGVVQLARWDAPNGDDSDMGNYLLVKDTTTHPVTYHLYLHLAQDSIPPELRTVGAPVIQGQFIGVADDTGASTGHHLHLQVQIPLYGENYYWGRSVDFAFDDVDINDGHPRVNASYCRDPHYCRDTDVCNTFRTSYTSQNVRRYLHPDTTPPIGNIVSPSTGETYGEILPLQAWAYDLGDPGEDPVGISSARFIVFYDGLWREVGPVFQPTAENPDFSFDWNWCDYNIPDGPISVALRLSDIRGNQSPPLLGLRHVTKNHNCHPPTDPPACQPASNQIALFSEINYRGNCQTLDIGEYHDSTAFSTVGENNTRSILVGESVWANLFTEANFHGRGEIVLQDDANLGENPV
ncbi:MAG TPA: M23 family metallopeptidase, partial [Anaerolineales bacterium]|nr:M23 family metallopeptidase [Anaerolineales bacterium]